MGGILKEVEDEDWEEEDYEEEEEYTSYELFLHYKQGDDFGHWLGIANGNVSEALELWAKSFDFNAGRCRELSKRFKDKDITAEADTHYIGFVGNEKLLEKLCEEDLLEKYEW